MKILIAGDSRTIHPSRPNNWPSLLENFLKQDYSNLEITKLLAVEDVQIFTLPILEEKIIDHHNRINKFDFAIIQCGWHDMIESWTKDIWKSLIPNNFNEKYFIEKIITNGGYPFSHGEIEYRYFNKQHIIDIIKKLKQISKHQLFIGMHSIRDGCDLQKKWDRTHIPPHIQGIPPEDSPHHYDVLKMNEFISAQDIDYLHMPIDFNWTIENTNHDKIHYHNNNYIVPYLHRYINRADKTINSILEKSEYNQTICINNLEIDKNTLYQGAKEFGSFISNRTKENDVVLIARKTSIEQLEAFLGCILYKRIPLIIQHPNNKVSEKEFNIKINHIKSICNPTLCYCESEHEYIYEQYFNCFSPSLLFHSSINPIPNISPDDICFYQLSSGTTSLCKIIEVTHKQLIENIDEYSNFIGFNQDDTIVSWLPLYHDMGLIACFLMPLIKGANFVHINNFDWLLDPSSLFKAIEENKGTIIYLPNFAFNYLYNKVDNNYNLSTLKQVISCSEPTSFIYLNKFAEKFNINKSKLKNCYALAENVFAVSQSNTITEDNGIASCGKILPGISLTIVREKDEIDVTNKEIGQIWIKSNNLSKSCQLSKYGYYNTGDIGYLKNQELYIIGRQSDKILSFGNTIYPDPIEQQINEIEGIIPGRVACCGIYDENFGTEIVTIIAESEFPNIQNIIKDINDILENTFNISGIVHIVHPNFLVKTSSGKISRYKTRDKVINKIYSETETD